MLRTEFWGTEISWFWTKCTCKSWLLTLSTLTVDPLYIDCWPSLHCTLTVDPLYIDSQSSLHWLLNLYTLTVDPLYTVHWLLTLSTLPVDPLYIHCQSTPPGSTVLIASVLCVDCWSSPRRLLIDPPTDFNFPIFNILMNSQFVLWSWSCKCYMQISAD